jgi:type II secretory pathway component PulF
MTDVPSLSARQSELVLATVADLAAAQLPLAEGLRAASSEATGRLARGLRSVAEELERGQTLEKVITDQNLRIPSHVRGMIAAASRTGQLGPALDELLEHQRAARAIFWRIWGSLAYPAFVLVLNIAEFVFLLCWVVPVFKTMFLEFQLTLPSVTLAIVAVSDLTVWLVLGPGKGTLIIFLVAVVILMFLAATGRGGAGLQRLIIESMPIFGVLWQWSGAAEFTYLLGSLLDKQVPLAEALRLTAEGTRKSDLRQSGRWMADEVAAGRSLSELVEVSGCLPASAVPLLRWAERTNSLPEALRILSEMFMERARMRSDWLRSVSPPFVYIFIGFSAASVIISLFIPLSTLIQGLS